MVSLAHNPQRIKRSLLYLDHMTKKKYELVYTKQSDCSQYFPSIYPPCFNKVGGYLIISGNTENEKETKNVSI